MKYHFSDTAPSWFYIGFDQRLNLVYKKYPLLSMLILYEFTFLWKILEIGFIIVPYKLNLGGYIS